MLTALLFAAQQRFASDAIDFPDLPAGSRGLPRLTGEPCLGETCGRCASNCPTGAIAISEAEGAPSVTIDRGLCVTCGACMEACLTGTIVPELSTRTAVRDRQQLVMRQGEEPLPEPGPRWRFGCSIDVREVSTGCNASDLEVAATTNPVFDCSRFGIRFVASPRFADVLLVTGPVGKAMHEPLVRTYEAMTEPKLVVAVGTCAISGGLHRGGYAEANGVPPHLPVAAYVPGCPPHPWSIIHGILLSRLVF
jgi:Ni,Fe-hydrogenase III small subunit/ferredoxin